MPGADPSGADFRFARARIDLRAAGRYADRVKVVSKRRPGQDPIRDSAILQRTLNRLRGNALVPRGVYRFSTHEEADEWMTRRIAATHARLSSKIS